MIDINFYRNTYDKQKLINQNENIGSKSDLISNFEKYRNKQPIVYNIETTNACNMRCKMCPRTTKMTRSVKTLTSEQFNNIISQLKPHSDEDWLEWENFIKKTYNIQPSDMSENHFFLYIIPQVIQLHGYGDPLLDKNLPDYVKMLSDNGFKSYFSCNPSNIDIPQTIKMFENGLDYIKYSIESVDDETFKSIRGDQSNFSDSFNDIMELINIKNHNGYKTKIVITMLNLNSNNQKEEFDKLVEKFKNLDVYIYLKSEDQQWYRKDYHQTKSIHWSEFCKHPWMSMTIKSDGEVAMCMEDYDNEIVLGDVNQESLYDIWNGEKYNQFRANHINNYQSFKCTQECDMNIIGKYLN